MSKSRALLQQCVVEQCGSSVLLRNLAMELDDDFAAAAALLEGGGGGEDPLPAIDDEFEAAAALMAQPLGQAGAREERRAAPGFAHRSPALMSHARTVKEKESLRRSRDELAARLAALNRRLLHMPAGTDICGSASKAIEKTRVIEALSQNILICVELPPKKKGGEGH